jgi:Tol biopolymer transport system component
MRRLTSVLAVATAICSLVFTTVPAQATYSGKNGRIAFATDRGHGPTVVKTIKKDGTDLRHVAWNAGDPDWAPDGTKIAFTRFHPTGPLGCSIEISNPDGTGVVDLGGSKGGCNFGPTFMPNGHRIVYVHDNAMGHQVILSMDRHGGDRSRIRPIPAGLEAHEPRVSPGGMRIAIQLSKSDTLRALFVLHTNGRGLRRLTPFKLNVGTVVDWSPSGDLIVFTELQDGPGNTMLIRPDGSGLTQITHFSGKTGAGGASFSPSGQWIVFRRQNDADGRFAIWRMHPDGSHRKRIRSLPVAFGGLDWGPKSA